MSDLVEHSIRSFFCLSRTRALLLLPGPSLSLTLPLPQSSSLVFKRPQAIKFSQTCRSTSTLPQRSDPPCPAMFYPSSLVPFIPSPYHQQYPQNPIESNRIESSPESDFTMRFQVLPYFTALLCSAIFCAAPVFCSTHLQPRPLIRPLVLRTLPRPH